MNLTGFHHLTSITGHAKDNLDFYTRVLGLRLVKKTVNQDDTSAYHFFYADGAGSPGTDITFFDWPHVVPERRGTRSIVRTGFKVASEEALNYWSNRFAEMSVKHSPTARRDNRAVLDFEDPEGQRLSLVVDASRDEVKTWDKSPIPPDHQLRGLGAIAISVPQLETTDAVLTQVMNFEMTRQYSENGITTHVYEMLNKKARPSGPGPASQELHVAIEPSAPVARLGAGGAHHVAFRVPTFDEYQKWFERLTSLGVHSSGPVDRFYFKSLYFREPNGILFELATDGPGFASDESIDSLGEKLSLPPFLEPRRAEIEAKLKPV